MHQCCGSRLDLLRHVWKIIDMFGNARRAEDILETCGHISEYLKAHRNAWENVTQFWGYLEMVRSHDWCWKQSEPLVKVRYLMSGSLTFGCSSLRTNCKCTSTFWTCLKLFEAFESMLGMCWHDCSRMLGVTLAWLHIVTMSYFGYVWVEVVRCHWFLCVFNMFVIVWILLHFSESFRST